MNLNEKFLYHIWDAGHIRNPLSTVSGKRIKITYQGQFNTNRGPDFSNVILELEGEMLRGSVEIHLKTSDWHAHNHTEDAYYNNVILHVVLEHNQKDSYTISEDGKIIEIVELKNQLSEDIAKLLYAHENNENIKLNTYCDLLSAKETDSILNILQIYGKMRFLSKVKRFNAMLSMSDFDQIMYEGFLEVLGYTNNKLNMLSLGQYLPLSKIKPWLYAEISYQELISIVLIDSGLLDRSKTMIVDELYQKLRKTYEHQPFHCSATSIDWQLFRIRPAAHPIFRLMHYYRFIHEHITYGLINYISKVVEPPNHSIQHRLNNMLECFNLETEIDGFIIPRIGKELINTAIVNVYLPVMYLYYGKLSQLEERDAILTSYMSYPALQDNQLIRFMREHISKASHKAICSKEIYQQGLIELYYKHCRYHLCSECVNRWDEIKDL